jgi:DnaJ-domain-containing protein 1
MWVFTTPVFLILIKTEVVMKTRLLLLYWLINQENDVSILESLRNDIENSLMVFIRDNKNLSLERKQNIATIKKILVCNNPLQLKIKLNQHLDTLSSGFISYLPFLEVNRFKNSVKSVLELPKYQENWILKAMIAEAGIQLSQDNPLPLHPDRSILLRVEKLEGLFQSQQQELDALQLEVKRLRIENHFLTETISMLNNENKQLVICNRQITQEKDDLKQKYETLIKENAALKKQMMELSKATPSKTQAMKENVPPKRALPRNTSQLSKPQSCKKPFSIDFDTDQTSTIQLEFGRKSLSARTYSVKAY